MQGTDVDAAAAAAVTGDCQQIENRGGGCGQCVVPHFRACPRVGGTTLEGDIKLGACQEPPAGGRHRTELIELQPDMSAENPVNPIEGTGVGNGGGAAQPLLGGLKNNPYGAVNLVAIGQQKPDRSDSNRRVAVMSAGVHQVGMQRLKALPHWKMSDVLCFSDVVAVDIHAKSDDRTGMGAFNFSDTSGEAAFHLRKQILAPAFLQRALVTVAIVFFVRQAVHCDAVMDFFTKADRDAQSFKLFQKPDCCTVFGPARLGITVEITPQRHKLLGQRFKIDPVKDKFHLCSLLFDKPMLASAA